jgi:uncharacterized membrane protein
MEEPIPNCADGGSERIVPCQVCGKGKLLKESMPGEMVRESVLFLIRKDVPCWDPQGFICMDDLSIYRDRLVRDVLQIEIAESNSIEADVARSIAEQDLLTKNLNEEFETNATLGQKVSDHIASFGGSWPFIGLFMLVLLSWILVNSFILVTRPVDMFPFQLLNLLLAIVAAFQAPIIMMSQNRQAERERLRGEHDYRINLKAEFEIRSLHEKVDHMLIHQWQRLMEIQQVQTDILEELRSAKK